MSCQIPMMVVLTHVSIIALCLVLGGTPARYRATDWVFFEVLNVSVLSHNKAASILAYRSVNSVYVPTGLNCIINNSKNSMGTESTAKYAHRFVDRFKWQPEVPVQDTDTESSNLQHNYSYFICEIQKVCYGIQNDDWQHSLPGNSSKVWPFGWWQVRREFRHST